MMNSERILCVGLAALDIVSICESYPEEDKDVTAISQHHQSGGNACNTAKVLRDLRVQCEFLGSMSSGFQSDFIRKEMNDRGILYENCAYHSDCGTPTSCVVLSLKTGSRTIVHARNNLPELDIKDFEKLDLKNYKWVHFEGRRNELKILKMIDIVDEFNITQPDDKKIKVSVELERPRETLWPLLSRGDVVFISKDFARFRGFSSPVETIKSLNRYTKPTAVMLCAWGEEGADGISPEGDLIHSDAYPPEKVIDTLGAGDTFNAGVIYSLYKGLTLQDTVNFACLLAGIKCGMYGYSGLAKALHHLQYCSSEVITHNSEHRCAAQYDLDLLSNSY